MKGTKSSNNCYMLRSQSRDQNLTYLIYKKDETKLWHKKLGHLNLRSMRKIIYVKVINGLPILKIEEGRICGDCQISKKTKMPHKKLQHLTTSNIPKLLHMDLMRPMKVESLGGMTYVFVCVDEYSIFT